VQLVHDTRQQTGLLVELLSNEMLHQFVNGTIGFLCMCFISSVSSGYLAKLWEQSSRQQHCASWIVTSLAA